MYFIDNKIHKTIIYTYVYLKNFSVAPPFVPTVTSVDDTSNFDDFEPENRPYVRDLSGKKEFTGKNLPFVGFTFTTPIEMISER